MEPVSKSEGLQATNTLNRRAVLAGTAATAVAVATHTVAAQGTPEATPKIDGELDPGRVMMVSANLCGGAILKANHVNELLEILNADAELVAPFEELEAVVEFTEEAMQEVSPEAQALAANILQYWFLGRYNGEPVENRAEMYFDFASWQTLPYSTEPSTCKSFGYWAVEVDV